MKILLALLSYIVAAAVVGLVAAGIYWPDFGAALLLFIVVSFLALWVYGILADRYL